MFKTNSEWAEEALNFIHEWGGIPEYKDVVDTVRNLSIDPDIRKSMEDSCGTVGMYAEELWFAICRQTTC